ncbi:hypothetical protein F0562_022855 [Nyssa sinensis]|uniref:Uncharacterized protein n=1 Tax=Nyssa sinensis TaxID=561372 RepID=A0A5J5BEY6_9ASTE|nr:hypothetical protein F0562_022855 [Nyssa sinensis]
MAFLHHATVAGQKTTAEFFGLFRTPSLPSPVTDNLETESRFSANSSQFCTVCFPVDLSKRKFPSLKADIGRQYYRRYCARPIPAMQVAVACFSEDMREQAYTADDDLLLLSSERKFITGIEPVIRRRTFRWRSPRQSPALPPALPACFPDDHVQSQAPQQDKADDGLLQFVTGMFTRLCCFNFNFGGHELLQQ